MKKTIIAPSLLSGDFSFAAEALREMEAAGADWVHLDIMDGNFVPDITFGSKMTADLRPHSKLPFDVHLMTADPGRHIDSFAKAGADYITFHLEAALHSHRLVMQIKARGVGAGISIVPSTPVSMLEPMLSCIDIVLVMTVNPGFGGQELIEMCVDKIKQLDELRAARGLNFKISADGGVNSSTAALIKNAGADVLITGSSFFNAKDRAEFVRTLRVKE
jgi:ribulose-phosphate 3-epimerase